jgi:hypothetical protein
MNLRSNRRSGSRSALARIAVAGSIAMGVIALTATASSAASLSPQSAKPAGGSGKMHNYHNTLIKNSNGWCDGVGDAPCDGLPGDYGTIDIVSHTFTNSGGYANGPLAGPGGQKYYARISGGQDGGTEGISGCTPTGTENCSGPYTLWGPKNVSHPTVFPTNGFSTSIKIYLDTVWANTYPGQLVGWDNAVSNTSGGFLQDQTFDICSQTGGFSITTAFGSGGCSVQPATITTSGWYTFNEDFTSQAGELYGAYSIHNASSTQVFSQVVDTGLATSGVGGPRYGWFPDEDVLGLPIAQVSLTQN